MLYERECSVVKAIQLTKDNTREILDFIEETELVSSVRYSLEKPSIFCVCRAGGYIELEESDYLVLERGLWAYSEKEFEDLFNPVEEKEEELPEEEGPEEDLPSDE